MKPLLFGSCMAPNADDFIRGALALVGNELDLTIRFVDWMTWPEREAAFDQAQIDLAWICGLPYVWKADAHPGTIRLLAAPVMAGERYRGRPHYFSDVVVRHSSSYAAFDDLAGTAWGYNEPRSHSGYNIVRSELARRGLDGDFIGSLVSTGSHQASLEALLQGRIDWAAIDSTVLETEFRRRPGLSSRLRVLETFGPSPAPPLIARAGFDPALALKLQTALTGLHRTGPGRAFLALHAVAGFAPVTDRSYDPIRAMDRLARSIDFR